MRNTSKVADYRYDVLSIGALTQIGNDVVIGIRGVDPLESTAAKVIRPEGGVGHVSFIECLDKAEDAVVCRIICEPPVETTRLIPFLNLGKLLAHEEQLLAGV